MSRGVQRRIRRNGSRVATLSPVTTTPSTAQLSGKTVVVVGTGFGGICAAIRLKELGVGALVLLERSSDVGGTWEANTYPGIAVDTSILQYSLSFEPNPDWSRLYADGSELQRYVRQVAEKYDLLRHIRFNTSVTELHFIEAANKWRVSTSVGDEYEADIVISATGPLSTPAIPAIPGLDGFQGSLLHAAQWDGSFSSDGMSVATIGTGATAAQVVPELAREAKHLYVFQRSAPWVFPRDDREITDRERWLYRNLPILLKVRRWRRFWANDRVQRGLEKQNSTIDKQTRFCLDFIERSIAGPELRAKVVPDYSVGCKRRVMSDDWYPALQRTNVTLETAGISEVTEHGIRGADGVERAVDAIILCTGYAVADFMPMKVFGVGGAELHDKWSTTAQQYLGVTVSGFPNLFLVGGPTTAIGAGSFIFIIESAVRYIVDAVDQMQRRAITTVEVKREVEREYYFRLQARLAKSVYGSGCLGWYQRPNGFIDAIWPGMTIEYWWRTRRFDHSKYTVSRNI